MFFLSLYSYTESNNYNFSLMHMNTKNIGLIAIALIIILGIGTFFFSNKGTEQIRSPSPTATVNKEISPLQAQYKDGEYKQEGDYTSPGGPEQIEVGLTLKDGVVTQSVVTSKAENPKSKYMQSVFVENYKPLVIGKNLKDLKLDKVAGSSLTPQGFNDAIEKIKAQALKT